MKGKKLLALASIFAGAALVGATFAAWAVTDNANTKKIQISGERINTDTGTSYVTLEYGESATLADVANLEQGTKRYAGAVNLVATYTGAESYNGLLKVSMDQTGSGTRLIDYLTIKVFDVDPTTGTGAAYDSESKIITSYPTSLTPILTITKTTTEENRQKSIAMTSGTPKTVYFVVEMAAISDLATINAIKSHVVNTSIDWDHDPTGQTVASSTTVYYKPTIGEGDKVYCYAWKGKVPNADWPGIEMNLESDGVYSYVINTTNFDHFILCYGKDGTYTKAQEADFLVSEVVGEDNFWDGDEWTTRPVADPTLTADYYVVGNFGTSGWACKADYAMTPDADTKDDDNNPTYVKTGLALTAGQKLKVRNNSNNANEEWYTNVSVWGELFTLDDEGNVVISANGTYTVRLYKGSNQNNHIVLDKTA